MVRTQFHACMHVYTNMGIYACMYVCNVATDTTLRTGQCVQIRTDPCCCSIRVWVGVETQKVVAGSGCWLSGVQQR